MNLLESIAIHTAAFLADHFLFLLLFLFQAKCLFHEFQLYYYYYLVYYYGTSGYYDSLNTSDAARSCGMSHRTTHYYPVRQPDLF